MLTLHQPDGFDSTLFDLSFGPTFFTDVVGLSTADALTDQADTSKYIINELRLASKLGGRTEFVAGVFQQHIKTTFETLVATSDPQGYVNIPIEPVFGQFQAHTTEQYALFGEVSYKITDKLTGLVGARAFYADESDDLNSTHPFGGFSPPVATPTLYSHAHKVTPKFYLSYQVTPEAMVYGSVSQGFGRVDYSYTGRQGTQFSPENPIYNVVPAYNLLAVRLGVRADSWEASLFGRNLLNAYAVNILEEASNLTPRAVVPNQPLTLGIELRYHF